MGGLAKTNVTSRMDDDEKKIDELFARYRASTSFSLLGDPWLDRAEMVRINRKEAGMPPLPYEDYEDLLTMGPCG